MSPAKERIRAERVCRVQLRWKRWSFGQRRMRRTTPGLQPRCPAIPARKPAQCSAGLSRKKNAGATRLPGEGGGCRIRPAPAVERNCGSGRRDEDRRKAEVRKSGGGNTSRRTKGLPETGRPFDSNLIRRRPTLPPGFPGSTIGAEELNFRVRDGNGCILSAMVTGKLIRCQAPNLLTYCWSFK